ncbi:MAG: CsgG/HfaB family protein [Spirochaetota bacterium]
MFKRVIVSLLIITAVFAAEKKPRVAVLAFNAKGVSTLEAETVTELFSSELVSSRAFDVLDRANMDNILKEQQFQQTGCTETACAVKLGKLLNVEFMIYGSVMNVGDKFYVSANMINIETSKIEKSGKEIADSFKEINSAIRRLIEKLTGVTMEESEKGTKIKYFGRITSVNGNEVTMNAGYDDGVRPGEDYIVLSGRKVKRRNDQSGMMENVNERTEIGKLRFVTVNATDSKGYITAGFVPAGSMVDLKTVTVNNVSPLAVSLVSIISPAAGAFMVKDNLGGQILGVSLELYRAFFVFDLIFIRQTYVPWVGDTYRGGITQWLYSSGGYLSAEAFVIAIVYLSGTVVNVVISTIAANYNASKYDELSKFAYGNELSPISFAIVPTPNFDGMSARFALRW